MPYRKFFLNIRYSVYSYLPPDTLAVGLYRIPPPCLAVGVRAADVDKFPTVRDLGGRLLYPTAKTLAVTEGLDPKKNCKTRSDLNQVSKKSQNTKFSLLWLYASRCTRVTG